MIKLIKSIMLFSFVLISCNKEENISITESKKNNFLKFTDKVLKVYKKELYTDYKLTSIEFPDSTKCNYDDTFVFTINQEYKRTLHNGNKTEGCSVININSSENNNYTEYWKFIEPPIIDNDYPNSPYLHLYGDYIVNNNAFDNNNNNLNETYIIEVENDQFLILIENNNFISMGTHYEKRTFYTVK